MEGGGPDGKLLVGDGGCSDNVVLTRWIVSQRGEVVPDDQVERAGGQHGQGQPGRPRRTPGGFCGSGDPGDVPYPGERLAARTSSGERGSEG